ncbi:MAG: MtrB/PioB family decaheme-associated outer membrane protein [Proteobacteria bacterium]|nr:MtrB/PioB family decaheme-associated outer membrane protein [Pseudomonadota bacterium]
MNKGNLLTLGAVSLCSCALLAAQGLRAEEEMVVTGDVRVAVQNLDVDGDAAGVEKYRDGLDDSAAVEQFDLWGSKDAFYFSLEGRDLGQKDQSLFGEVGKYGQYKLKASWDEVPRNYADGTYAGTLTSGGYWAVPNVVQGILEQNFTPLDQQPSAANQRVLQNFLLTANKINLEQQRETGAIELMFTPVQNMDISAGYARQTKEGMRAFSTGSYRRDKLGAENFGGVGENFRLYGQEVPGLIDNETQTFDLGLDYSRDNWFMDFSYRYVDFANNQGSVTWDNPLLLIGQDNEQGGSPINRLDQAPDYESDTFSFTGGIAGLPLRSRFTATFSRDQITQDDDFLAYTVNPAVLDADGNIAATRPLPASNLDGDVETTFVNLVLNSSPLPRTTVNLRYKSYDYANDSKRIDWDGWVRIAETDWKEADYVNRVPEYEKTTLALDGTYRFGRKVKLKAEISQEEIDRNDHRAADNTEDSYGATIQISAADWALLRFGYRFADRTIDGEYIAEIEQSHGWEETHMFDMAERERQTLDAYVGLDPMDNLSVGFNLTYIEDEYNDKVYGLHDAESLLMGIDLNYWLSDSLQFSAYYSREDRDSTQLNRTKSDNTGNGAFEVPENDWATDLGDTTDALGFALDATLIPDKLTMALSLNYSMGEATFDTRNTDYVAGITTTSATAYPWSDVESEMTEFKAEFDYYWTDQLSTGFRYYYTKFDLDDFAVDNVSTYNGNPVGAQGNASSHFIFMDANHNDYDAHFVALTLAYAFN